MTPRTSIVCLDLEDTIEESLMQVSKHKFTRYPVCRGDKDSIVGFVHVKDLYLLPRDTELNELPIRPVVAAPETMPAAKLLQLLQTERSKMAVVIDEHGGMAGVVTMADIMEQVVGPIDDECFHDDSEEIKRLADGTYLIDGGVPVNELIDIIGFEPVALEDSDTVGGLFFEVFGRIPEEGIQPPLKVPLRCPVHRLRSHSPSSTWTDSVSTRCR